MLSQYSTDKGKKSARDYETEPASLLHPEAAKAESIIRNAWYDARLVGH